VLRAFGLDSNCLVAILCAWHEHHVKTKAAFEQLCAEGEVPIYVAAHSLLECFASMTGFPKPMKVSPAIAISSMDKAFGMLEKKESNLADAVAAMEACRVNGLASGSVYDALIVQTLHRHGVSHLLTWNLRHLERVAPNGLQVLRPDQVLL